MLTPKVGGSLLLGTGGISSSLRGPHWYLSGMVSLLLSDGEGELSLGFFWHHTTGEGFGCFLWMLELRVEVQDSCFVPSNIGGDEGGAPTR